MEKVKLVVSPTFLVKSEELKEHEAPPAPGLTMVV